MLKLKQTRSIASMAEPIFVVAKGTQKGFIFLYETRRASIASLKTCSSHETHKKVTTLILSVATKVKASNLGLGIARVPTLASHTASSCHIVLQISCSSCYTASD